MAGKTVTQDVLPTGPAEGYNLRQLRESVADDLDIDQFVLDIVRPAKGEDNLDVAPRIIDGWIERTMEGASNIRVTIHDPIGKLLNSSVLNSAIDVEIDGLWWRLVGIAKNDADLELVFEDRDVAYIRSHKDVIRASRRQLTRLEFCAYLLKRVKKRRFIFIAPELHVKQEIGYPKDAGQSVREEVKNRKREAGINNDGSLKVWYSDGKGGFVGKRARSSQIEIAEQILDVAAKRKAWNKRRLMVAAIATAMVEASLTNPDDGDRDSAGAFQQRPSQGWGTEDQVKDVDHASKQFYERAVSHDKSFPGMSIGELCQKVQGSAHPTRYAQAVPLAEAFVDAYGDVEVGQVAYRKKYMFTTMGNDGKPEDWWKAMHRLLDEVNFACFMSNGVLYMIDEKKLIKSKIRMRISEATPGITRINFNYDIGQPIASATVQARATRWVAPPGTVVELAACGPASGRWLVSSTRRSFFSRDMTIELKKPEPTLPEPPSELITREGTDESISKNRRIKTTEGARKMVEKAVNIAIEAGGEGVYVASDHRPEDRVASGAPSDHSSNNQYQAARDIAVKGIDALVGPPSTKLDRAVVQIGKAFNRDYGNGKTFFEKHGGIDQFEFGDFRVQIIWRTPKWGGHLGHIHIGIKLINRPAPKRGHGGEAGP